MWDDMVLRSRYIFPSRPSVNNEANFKLSPNHWGYISEEMISKQLSHMLNKKDQYTVNPLRDQTVDQTKYDYCLTDHSMVLRIPHLGDTKHVTNIFSS